MIANEAELERARQNLANVGAAIESLRKQLLPNHERNFNLYARPWIDLQQEFQADIDAYLGKPSPSRNGVPAQAESPDTKPLELT